MKLPILFFLALLAMGNPIGTLSQPVDAAQPADDDSKANHVRLIIDFGEGFQKHYTHLAYKEEMTVLDAMQQAEKHRFPLQFSLRGRRDRTLLTAIDGQENEGSGNRNWIFQVNRQVGDRSFAIYELKAGDTILWRFQRYR